MSFAEVLQEIPRFTPEERQILMRRVLDLEDEPFTVKEDALIQERLNAHRSEPSSSMPLEAMKSKLRSKFNQ